MTNGEKIQTILDVDRDCTKVHGENGTMTFTVTQDFWNAEYKEPTLDKIRAEIEQTVDEEQKHDEKWSIGLRYAIKVIDKYREEQE